MTVSFDELAEIAAKASRRAGDEARASGITVAAIDVPKASSKAFAKAKRAERA
jgi:hypothetical protein